MIMLKKIIKIQLLGFISFGLMTLLLTAVLMFTSFKEEWSYVTLIVILCVVCFFVGILQGHAAGKRGLIVGISASLITLISILAIINMIYSDDFKLENDDFILLIPLLLGAVGGVVGTNSNK